MDKFLLFPYHGDTATVARYRQLLVGHELLGMVSYREDMQMMEKLRDEQGVAGYTNVQDAPSEADTLVLADCPLEQLPKKYGRCIHAAQKRRMAVGASAGLCKRVEAELGERAACTSYEAQFAYPADQFPQILFDIPVPVIAVMGLGENTGKFETQILLKAELEDMGYRVTGLGSNPLSALFGFYNFPPFLFDHSMRLPDKIHHFNTYIYRLYEATRPDVILLGVPGGMVPLGEGTYNCFGEIPYIVSHAVSIDAGMVNLYFGKHLSEEYLASLTTLCRYKFNMPVFGFCMSRYAFQFIPDMRQCEYYRFEDAFIEKILPDDHARLPVTNLFGEVDLKPVASHIIQCLSKNLPAV